jgi:hypothetical protein
METNNLSKINYNSRFKHTTSSLNPNVTESGHTDGDGWLVMTKQNLDSQNLEWRARHNREKINTLLESIFLTKYS